MSEGELERTQVDQVGTDALVAEERRRRWKAENGEAIAQHNAWIEEHGLPLAEHRSF